MSNNDVIEKIVSDFKTVQAEFEQKAQTAMRSAFKEFFDANPRINNIEWTQYSPHFNDGDECIFGVHDMYAGVVGASEMDDYDEDEYAEERVGTISSWGSNNLEGYEIEEKNFRAFTKLINQIPDEVFQATFGNHAKIIATRDGFDVEEYEHD